MRTLGRVGLLATVVCLAGCAQQPVEPPDTRAADETAIRSAAEDWSASAEAKDAERFASFYSDDAVLMLENAPDVRGRAAIGEAMGGMMQDPNFALSFQTDDVVVARSGDLAYETGTYSLTMSDAEKNPATQKGHYVEVWQEQGDGTWKVVVDAPVSDPPEEPAEE